jgi:CHAT domain-containing protein/tetratricopeptide (TPR) repeat protein
MCVDMGVTRAAVALASAWAATGVAFATCSVPARSVLSTTELRIQGSAPVQARVPVPAHTEILVVAFESGVDVRLERTLGAQRAPATADNPARRFGPRRMVFSTGAEHAVTFTATGKDREDSRGIVQLRVAPLASAGSPACIEAYRLLAQGDRHYAAAGSAKDDEATGHSVDPRSEQRAAVEGYEKVTAVLATRPLDPLVAQANLFAAAVYYQDLQEWAAAARAATRAQAQFLVLREAYAAARARAMEAAAEMELPSAPQSSPGAASKNPGPPPLARIRATFLGLARFHAARHELFDEALALNNAGLADDYVGKFSRAVGTFHQALAIYTQLRERGREAQVLHNIGLVERDVGEFAAAKRDFASALALTAADPASRLRPQTLNNEALAEYDSGDLDAALRHYGAALEIFRSLQWTREEARSLQGLGSVYYAAGDRARALDYFTRALAIRSAALDPRGRTATLRALASVLSDLHQPERALSLHREALALAVVPAMRVRIEAQMAGDLEALGRRAGARAMVGRAIEQDVGRNRAAQAAALLARGELNFDEGRDAPAGADTARALRLLRGTQVPAEQIDALVLAARIAREEGAPGKARRLVRQALDLAEQVRVESANPELRAGLWSAFRPAFDLLIELLDQERSERPAKTAGLERSSALDMLVVAERARARSLSDYQSRHALATGGSDPTARRIESLYDEVADRRFQLETLLDRVEDTDPRVRTIRAEIATLQREIDTLHRVAGEHAPGAPTTERLRSQLGAVIEMIPSDAAVVEYWLGTTQARAWVVTRQSVRTVALGPTARVDHAARALYASLRSYSSVTAAERSRLISELSALIIRPLAPALAFYRALVIIPDGALHYVPFAVLGAGDGVASRNLLAGHVLVTAPSLASAAWAVGTHSRPTRTLIVSDPVYSDTDERLSAERKASSYRRVATVAETGVLPFRGLSAEEGFERLPGSALEGQSILRLTGEAEVDSLSGFAASRESFLARDLSQYRLIHIAAHGLTDTQAPQLSAVILSLRDARGAAQPGEVFAGDFLSRTLNADLVVLSACDTALGRELGGEGLLGLRYALHAAGARSVIASLWQVPDRTATQLMSDFYSHYLHGGESPPEALAAAMRELERQFPDPALWGAFDLSAVGANAIFSLDQDTHSKEAQ